jgi:predicted  nucleic acid-binding Zn-ribbon protein
MTLMSRWLLERRLSQATDRLAALRAELAHVEEQCTVFADEAADHELRALVSETPLAGHEASDARRHASAMARHRDHLLLSIADLERRQDDILDSLGAVR